MGQEALVDTGHHLQAAVFYRRVGEGPPSGNNVGAVRVGLAGAAGLVPGGYFAAVTGGGGTTPESRRVLPLTVAR